MAWKREPLIEDELNQLLDAADRHDLEHKTTIRVLAHTGMRADEFAHMRSGWVDWQDELVRVPAFEDCNCSNCAQKAAARNADIEQMWIPKTEHGARTIPLKEPDTLRTLRDYFSHHETIGVTRQTIGNRVKRVASDTEIRKKITPHVLRHTYGTLIAARGATPQYIRQTMGHADLSSANDYLQYAGTQLDAEAEELW
ncbi:tyrosine-type recombinase/integrase [Halobaculum sp. P14]|uniref:tyrosine-type recombinase/integrase n=1 Tax=Halobaculum sp. P14 TaxID=3421638 RepID=UPI003EC076B3